MSVISTDYTESFINYKKRNIYQQAHSCARTKPIAYCAVKTHNIVLNVNELILNI